MDETTEHAAAPARVRDRPTWLISRAYARSSGLLNAGFESGADGLRSTHFRLLAALEEAGATSQAELGRNTGIDRSDVTAAMNELEARKLVARAVDPADRRRNIVTLTPAGVRRLEELDLLLTRVQEQVLEPLSATEARQLLALLRRLNEQ